jgi:hypothetical protein
VVLLQVVVTEVLLEEIHGEVMLIPSRKQLKKNSAHVLINKSAYRETDIRKLLLALEHLGQYNIASCYWAHTVGGTSQDQVSWVEREILACECDYCWDAVDHATS